MNLYHIDNIKVNLQIEPDLLNHNLNKNIFEKGKTFLTDNCINDKYIKDVISLESKSLGIINDCDTNCSVNYDVIFKANICAPEKGQRIECIITCIDDRISGIISYFKPILITILNFDNLPMFENCKVGNRVMVEIISKRFQKKNDVKIAINAKFVKILA